MAAPSSNNSRLANILFAFSTSLGLFSLGAPKLLKNTKIPPEVVSLTLIVTSVGGLYLHGKDLRQIQEMDEKLQTVLGQNGILESQIKEKAGALETASHRATTAENKLQTALSENAQLQLSCSHHMQLLDVNETKLISSLEENKRLMELYGKSMQSKKDELAAALQKNQELQARCDDLNGQILAVLIPAYQLFQLVSDQKVSKEAIQADVTGFLKVLPQTLESFKPFLESLRAEVDEYMPPDAYQELVKNLVRQLKANPAQASIPAAGVESEQVISLVLSIYDLFGLLSDDALPQRDDIAGNLGGYLAGLPGTIKAFKEFVEGVKRDLDANLPENVMRVNTQKALSQLKSCSPHPSPARGVTTPRPAGAVEVAKHLVFSPVSPKSPEQTQES